MTGLNLISLRESTYIKTHTTCRSRAPPAATHALEIVLCMRHPPHPESIRAYEQAKLRTAPSGRSFVNRPRSGSTLEAIVRRQCQPVLNVAVAGCLLPVGSALHRTRGSAGWTLFTGVDSVVSVSSLNPASGRPPEASTGQPRVSSQAARQPGSMALGYSAGAGDWELWAGFRSTAVVPTTLGGLADTRGS